MLRAGVAVDRYVMAEVTETLRPDGRLLAVA
jgi:hypothetical protein